MLPICVHGSKDICKVLLERSRFRLLVIRRCWGHRFHMKGGWWYGITMDTSLVPPSCTPPKLPTSSGQIKILNKRIICFSENTKVCWDKVVHFLLKCSFWLPHAGQGCRKQGSGANMSWGFVPSVTSQRDSLQNCVSALASPSKKVRWSRRNKGQTFLICGKWRETRFSFSKFYVYFFAGYANAFDPWFPLWCPKTPLPTPPPTPPPKKCFHIHLTLQTSLHPTASPINSLFWN